MKKKYIYFHICCIGDWINIVRLILYKIKESGLYDIIDEIRCCILEKNKDVHIPFFFEYKDDDKIKIYAKSDNIYLYETFTINKLLEDSKQEDFEILYIHSKGITKSNNINIKDWLEYLCYFTIYKYEICLMNLKNNDVVGVNLLNTPIIHFSGNFWWSKSSYIQNLKICVRKSYNSPEYWITESRNGSYLSLWTSNTAHYYHRYPSSNYINKELNNIICYPHHLLNIYEAIYGVLGDPNLTINVTDIIKKIPIEKNILKIQITNESFGFDPCMNKKKQLFILYSKWGLCTETKIINEYNWMVISINNKKSIIP
jgi:hypothetical protein